MPGLARDRESADNSASKIARARAHRDVKYMRATIGNSAPTRGAKRFPLSYTYIRRYVSHATRNFTRARAHCSVESTSEPGLGSILSRAAA